MTLPVLCIYDLWPPEEGYELCQPIHKEDYENIRLLVNGELRRKTWKPIPMRIIKKDQGKKLLSSDSPWFGSDALVFKYQAVEAMTPLLQKHGELLPLLCKETEVTMYNPTHVLEALDPEKAIIKYFPNSSDIMMVKHYSFREELVRDVDIFKLPGRASNTFVSQRFVDLWNASGLKGLRFRLIWSSDSTKGISEGDWPKNLTNPKKQA